ncbi:helicase associated domain-containing protein [Streptomyces sp. NPDC004561]
MNPSWCPAWPVEWQRAFHLTRLRMKAGGTLPTAPGPVVHQGEDLARWVRAQRLDWERLTTVQQWMCEHVLGIRPAGEDELGNRRSRAATLTPERIEQLHAIGMRWA